MTTNSRSDLEKYSFSKLQTFEQCPYQYYLNYIQHNKDGEGNAMSEFGSFCHSILERHFKGELEVFELADVYEKEYNDNILHKFPEMPRVDLEDKYYNDGMNFFCNFDEQFESYEILGVEKEIALACNETENPFLFRGYIDLLYIDSEGRLVVHDWKSKSSFTKKDLPAYGKQLYLYARYCDEQGYGLPDILRFYCFRSQKAYDIKFDITTYDATWQWVYDTVEKIRKCELFEQNKDSEFMCNELCDYRYICKEDQMGFLDD